MLYIGGSYGAPPPTSVEYLIVAGGGLGGSDWLGYPYPGYPPGGGTYGGGGGGGAGGYRTSSSSPVSINTTYPVTVGGAASNSSFNSVTSAAGGAGGDIWNRSTLDGAPGGSGGGGQAGYLNDNPSPFQYGAGGTGNTPSASPSQGNNGGTADAFSSAGGGGSNASNSISGSPVTYATGGGVAAQGNNGANAPANTGNGGQAGNANWQTPEPAPVQRPGGTGGSGIVIIAYPESFAAAKSTTGSPTITTSGGKRIYKFTGSGSITW
jgi:hypothetical protein